MNKTGESGAGEAKCFSCGRSDNEVALIAVKFKGEDKWICAKCLPMLIHG